MANDCYRLLVVECPVKTDRTDSKSKDVVCKLNESSYCMVLARSADGVVRIADGNYKSFLVFHLVNSMTRDEKKGQTDVEHKSYEGSGGIRKNSWR